ncbi:MAG: hypothetical protein IPH21_07500 [Flavobacteriales bacterium]|nr:hypothetical protein [Flavobacteriales bacterium]
MRNNIKMGLSRLIPVALLAFLDNVIAKFTGSTLFSAPPVTVVDMQNLSDELRAAIEAATGGSIVTRKVRDAKVLEAQEVLRLTADYVRLVCRGNAADLAASGFPLAKQPEPINIVAVPRNVEATATDVTGVVKIRHNKAEGARMYRTERAMSDPTAGETTWVPVGLTSRLRLEITGLQPYEACWFRVIGVGKTSEGLPSDIVLGRAA